MKKYKMGDRVKFIVYNEYTTPKLKEYEGTIVNIRKSYKKAHSNKFNKTPKTYYDIQVDKIRLPFSVLYSQIKEVV